VHLSDIEAREAFRRVSVIQSVCAGQFMGEGATSYLRALAFLTQTIRDKQQ
jgi:3-dehydroquinate dehydratase